MVKKDEKAKKLGPWAAKTRFRSIGVRHSVWEKVREHCHNNDMSIADFTEASIQYCMEHNLTVQTKIIIDLGDLKK